MEHHGIAIEQSPQQRVNTFASFELATPTVWINTTKGIQVEGGASKSINKTFIVGGLISCSLCS